METNEKNNLTENTIVSFNINDAIKGIGIIKGIANRSLPVIGKSYIIEILSSKGIDKKTYPYSSIVVFENFIEVKHF